MRRWTGILGSLAAGPLITCGVAWSIALLGDIHTFRGQYRADASWWRTPGYMRGVLEAPTQGTLMPGRIAGFREVGIDFPVPTETGLQAGWFTVWSSEFGWPWPAVRWEEMTFRPQYDDMARGRIAAIRDAFEERAGLAEGIELSGWAWPNERPRRLPVTPIWGAFLADSGVHAAAVYGAGSAGVWLWGRRARLRRAAGRCAACGYELGGLARCPECGRGG